MTKTVINLDRFKSKRAREGAPTPTPEAAPAASRKTRLPRHQGLWAAVQLEELTERRHDKTYSAHTRLLLLLRIRSRRGRRPVRLTNEMAAEIGLDRSWKRKCLHYLESAGYVTVKQVGQRVPMVTVL